MTQACQLTATEMGQRTCQLDGTLSACAAIPCVPGPPQQCANSDAGVTVRVCQADAGFSACFTAPCTQSISCPFDGGTVELFGERACLADGGYDVCRENAQCSLQLGECAGARRLFDDQMVGCGPISYRENANWRSAETCPGDDLDNDCDGETDEVGPTVVLAEGATEVAAIGEFFALNPQDESRYRVLLVIDGGIVFQRLDELLRVTGSDSEPATRSDGGRLEPRFGLGASTETLVSWVDDHGVIFAKQSLGQLGPVFPWSFSLPGFPVAAQAALVDDKHVVAVFFDAPIGGGFTRLALVSQSEDGGFTNTRCDSPNSACLPDTHELVGWNGSLGILATGGLAHFLSARSGDRDLQADGGPLVILGDGGFANPVFFGIPMVPAPLIRQVRGALYDPQSLAVAAQTPTFAVSFLIPGQELPVYTRFGALDSDATQRFTSTSSQKIPVARVSGASAVARPLDGGAAVVLTAFTLDGGVALTPLSTDAGVRWIPTPTNTGKAILAWSKLSPNKALLTMPVKAADGGSQVIGRQLCMPEWVP